MKRTNTRQQRPALLPSSVPTHAAMIVHPDHATMDDDEVGVSTTHDNSTPDDHVLQPPLWLFILGTIEICWGAISNAIQATTSFTAMIGWQQSDIITALGPVNGAVAIVQRSPAFALIALVIAVSSQIAIQITSQKISRQWKQKRLEHESGRQAFIEIVGTLDMATIFGYTGFLACAVSDYTFISVYDFNPFLMVFWAIFLACSSTYVLIDGVERVTSGVLALRSWKLWQQAQQAHFANVVGEDFP